MMIHKILSELPKKRKLEPTSLEQFIIDVLYAPCINLDYEIRQVTLTPVDIDYKLTISYVVQSSDEDVAFTGELGFFVPARIAGDKINWDKIKSILGDNFKL